MDIMFTGGLHSMDTASQGKAVTTSSHHKHYFYHIAISIAYVQTILVSLPAGVTIEQTTLTFATTIVSSKYESHHQATEQNL